MSKNAPMLLDAPLPMTAQAIAARSEQGRKDARTPHARAALRLQQAIFEALLALAELERLGPKGCPARLFTSGGANGHFWRRMLPGFRWSLEQMGSEMASEFDGPAAYIAAEEAGLDLDELRDW